MYGLGGGGVQIEYLGTRKWTPDFGTYSSAASSKQCIHTLWPPKERLMLSPYGPLVFRSGEKYRCL